MMSAVSVKQQTWLNLRGAVLGLLACLLFLEILLRVFPFARLRLEPQHFYQPNSVRGWEMTPNTQSVFHTTEYRTLVKINEEGFRDELHILNHPGVFRILGLGGSFTFGYGVEAEQDYLQLLEKKLRPENSPASFDVMNMGVPSYSFRQNELLLKEKGLKYHPDLVLLSFVITDPMNSLQPESTFYEGYLLKGESLQGHFLKEKLFLFSHVKSFHFLAKILDYTGTCISDGLRNRNPQYVHKKNEEQQKAFHFVEKQLSEMQRWCQENKITLVVMFTPHRGQIDSSKSTTGRLARSFDMSQKLATLCGKEKIPFIDLLPEFIRLAQSGERLYFNIDAHWNLAGHRAAAEIIYKKLTGMGLLPHVLSSEEKGL